VTDAAAERRAIRWLAIKVAIFILVPVIAAAILVPLSLK
jgi:hypothetical protein